MIIQQMRRYLNRFFGKNYPKISLDELTIVRKYEYDDWNKVEGGQVSLNVYRNDKRIAYTSFRKTGQIGLIDVEPDYRRQGIAKFMLQSVEQELTCDKIWAICTKEHYFWSNQNGYTYEDRPHVSVTGSGFSKRIGENRR